jgi:chromate transporter
MTSVGLWEGKASAGNPTSIAQMVLYFLRLGSLGFGGPVALANAMRHDLVETRGWITEHEYDQGLAIAAACPGPLAYQLAVYCGFIRRGVRGGLAVAVAFALPPFLLVLAAAHFYSRYSDDWRVRALFYGVAPVVVALILKACWNLGTKTLGREPRAWIFFLLACGITVVVQRELVAVFLGAGVLGAFLLVEPDRRGPVRRPPKPGGLPAALALPFAAVSGGSFGITGQLFVFFFKTGFLVFGSGLVIVPFLKTYVVDQYHWLGNRQFLDAVAIGMISPGPVVISATFVGYLLGGVAGAAAASIGIFAPAVLFTILATPLLLRHAGNRRLQGFLRGITLAVVGVLVGTTYLVGKSAIGDALTTAIALASLLALFRFRRLPEPALVAAGALVGLLAYPLLQPAWLLR